MRTNTPTTVEPPARTYEGAPAHIPAPKTQLIRQVATCMLWESTFYEKGSTIADQIAKTCAITPLVEIARVAKLARTELKLRHAPLFLLAQMNKRRLEAPGLLAGTVPDVVQRADELAELVSIVCKVEGREPKHAKKILSHGLQKGLARAFRKFNEYALAKYDREGAIRLRDVLFLCHPKPKDAEQAELWKRVASKTLATPDTWEVALSAGADKKATWERLISEKQLGYMALLRNLRNMTEANVSQALVERALLDGAENSRALPFRFIAAAKHAPAYAQALSDSMLKAISGERKLPGVTAIVVDVSGSMDAEISGKSEINRWQAAAGVAILAREVCEFARVFTFSNQVVEVQNLRGLPLLVGIDKSQGHGGTALRGALEAIFRERKDLNRVIVFTDEQSSDGVAAVPAGVTAYMVNVASYEPALMLGKGWTRINGFSERIVDWIRFEEQAD